MNVSKSIIRSGILAFGVLLFASPVWTQQLSISGATPNQLGLQRLLAGAASLSHSEEHVAAEDTIVGNGTKAGYTLNHGGLLKGSETVTVDGQLKLAGIDYTLDALRGTFTFTAPVPAGKPINVSYRYAPSRDGGKSGISKPDLALMFGANNSVSMAFGTTQENGLTTYGLNLTSNLGNGSTMKNMMYSSGSRGNFGMLMGLQSGLPMAGGASVSDKGSLFINSTDLHEGKLGIKLDMQQVGKDFNGFETLRLKQAAPDDVLRQLEKEKGLQRMGLNANYSLGHKGAATLGFNRISSNGAEILRQSFSAGQGPLKLSADLQKVDAKFSRFTDIADPLSPVLALNAGTRRSDIKLSYAPAKGWGADIGMLNISDEKGSAIRESLKLGNDKIKMSLSTQQTDKQYTRVTGLDDAQWALETGMKRNAMQLSLAPMKGLAPTSAWNSLNLNEIGDAKGKASSNDVNFAVKGFSFYAADSKIDKTFNRFASLGIADQQQIALGIYKQFDPNATAAGISPYDLLAIPGQAGVERRNIRSDFKVAGTSIGMQFVNVGDQTGGVDRETLSLQGKSYKVTGLLQSIDKAFTRVGSLSPIELTNFGKEYGMDRMNLTGDFTLKPGRLLSTNYTQVTQDNGNGLTKYGLSYSDAKLKMSGQYQNIDPGFTRVKDLADKTKKKMALELGMSRYNLTTTYQASKAIKLDSVLYDAEQTEGNRFIRQFTNTLTLNPTHGPNISLLNDEKASGTLGAESDFQHQKFTLGDKMGAVSLNMLFENSVNQTPIVDQKLQTQGIGFATDPAKASSVSMDWQSVRSNNGKDSDLLSFSVKQRLAKNLDLSGSQAVATTTKGEQTVRNYGLSGKFFGNTTLSAKMGEAVSAYGTVAKTQELSIQPSAPKNYGSFKKVIWVYSFTGTENPALPTAINGNTKIETEAFGNKVSFARTAGLTDYSNPAILPGLKMNSTAFTLASTPGPKRRLNYNIAYKGTDYAGGSSLIQRDYSVDYRANDTTKLAYSYTDHPENKYVPGTLNTMSTGQLKMVTSLNKRLQFIGQVDHSRDYTTELPKDTISMGLSGKVSKAADLEASYGFDKVGSTQGLTSSRTFKVKYDCRVSTEQFLTFSGKFTDWVGKKPVTDTEDDVFFQFDFRTLWN